MLSAMTRFETPAGVEEVIMPRKQGPNTEATTIKFSPELVERANVLAKQANEDPFALARATRTDVLRMAVELGLKQLEERAKSKQ